MRQLKTMGGEVIKVRGKGSVIASAIWCEFLEDEEMRLCEAEWAIEQLRWDKETISPTFTGVLAESDNLCLKGNDFEERRFPCFWR